MVNNVFPEQCCVETMRSIAKLDDFSIRFFEDLSNSEDVELRCIIASKRNCPLHILKKLAFDPVVAVLFSVVENRSAPVALFEHLANHENEDLVALVNERMKERLELYYATNFDSSYAKLIHALNSIDCPIDFLDQYYMHPDPIIRCVIANNFNCPDYILQFLAKDPQSHVIVLCFVSLNDNCSDVTLRLLSRHFKIFVSFLRCLVAGSRTRSTSVASYFNSPSSFNSVDSILDEFHSVGMSQVLLKLKGCDHDHLLFSFLMSSVASHKNCPPAIRRKLLSYGLRKLFLFILPCFVLLSIYCIY